MSLVKPRADAPPEPSAPPTSAPPRTVTFRAVLLGMALMVVNSFWIIMMERIRYSAHPTTISLFFNCVFILVVLTGLNGLVARVRPRWAMCQGELLLIYAMLNIDSCMSSHDMGQILVSHLTWPYSQATPSNGYAQLFGNVLPKWALMPDKAAAQGYWLGNDTLYTYPHLAAWLQPTLVWTGFITVLLFVMQCVNVLIRKQWTDNERLTYPLVRLPLEITDAQPGGRGRTGLPLTRNRLFWLGFILAAAVDLNNSLNYYFPNIPAILTPGNGQSSLDLSQFLTAKPWNAVGWTPASFYPFVIGLGILMPLDFLFSSWFFYLTWKLQHVLVVANAWDANPNMPYDKYQAFGAYMLFFASTVYLSRHYFKQVARRALGLSSEIDDSDEPLRYRWAFVGIVVGLVLLIAFTTALGLSPWLGIAFFAIYLALALAITRMRAELGTPVHDLHFTGPNWMFTDLAGPRALGPSNLAALSTLFWFNRAYRSHPMPFQLEAFKMAEQSGGRREMNRWFWVLILAGGFGMICTFWAMLHTYYIFGGQAKASGTFGPEAWDNLAGYLKAPKQGDPYVAVAIVVGFLFATFLQVMRVQFPWWPFHPLAYAVSSSWEMNLLWMPLLIAWAVKSTLLRYGGMKMYQASLPFFYGLILGQFIPGSLLNLWGIITNTPTYQFWQ